MSSFSFIHAADLHLDSPFSSLGEKNLELSEKMRSATFEAFENLIQLCLDKEVDFLLIAGDIFDSVDRSLKAQVRFRDGLKRLDEAGIQSFVVHGNHDPLSGWSATLEWPSGVHIFKDNLETLEIKRDRDPLALIQGISFAKKEERRNLSRLFKRTNSGFHIGILHANLGSDTGHEPYAPCSLDDLRKAGMDYWALGHVHNRRIYSRENPAIIYPGNSQGRNIRENGEKGCYLVRVNEDREIDTEFFPTDVIRWFTWEIKIDEMETEQDIIDALNNACLEISKKGDNYPIITQVTLTGNGPLFGYLLNSNVINDLLELAHETGTSLSPFIWIDQIKTNIGPEIDIDEIKKRKDFTGELLRLSEDLSNNTDIATLLKQDLSPLFENPRAHRFLDFPNNDILRNLLERAQRRCLRDLLGEEFK